MKKIYYKKIKALILSEDKGISIAYKVLLKDTFEQIDEKSIDSIVLNYFYDYDLIVIDVDSFSTFQEILKLSPNEALSGKSLIISPFSNKQTSKMVPSSFASLLLTKPLQSNKFLEAISNLHSEIVNHYLLKEKNAILIDFFNNSPFRIGIFDLDGKLFFCNSLYLKAKHIEHDNYEYLHFNDINPCEHEFENIKSRLLLQDNSFSFDKKENDTGIWFRSTFYKLNKSFIVHKCEDITQDIKAQDKLKQSSIFFENANEGILITDEFAKILSVNSAFSKITGYMINDVIGKNPSILQSGVHKKEFYTNMWDSLKNNGLWQGEIWNKRKNGEIYPEWLSISKIKDNNTLKQNFYIAIFTDITNLKEADKRIYFYANHDHLTGLANRLNIESRFSHSIELAKRKGHKVGLLFIDIDNFKDINDTYSHEMGDEVIKTVANMISLTIRDSDTLGRIGGDEFLIILNEIENSSDIVTITQKIKDTFKDPVSINGNVFYITLSIGISIYPEHGESTDILQKNADLAMYEVKKNGRNGYCIYNSEFSTEVASKTTIFSELRAALKNDELAVFYQPVLNYKTNEFSSAEALVRWIHPEKGIIPPMDFLPIAEDKGLISELTAEIFYKVLNDLEEINKRLQHQKFKIAVNISAKDFFSKDFTSTLIGYFEGFDIDFNQIELEITETQIMHNHDVAKKIIKELKEFGFKLAIDDFGTGYSSLSYLKHFNIDKLKIDKSFILDAIYDKNDALIAKTITDLGKNFELTVQAEGVEEEKHEEFVKEIGCDYGQGYFYSKPINFKEFINGFT